MGILRKSACKLLIYKEFTRKFFIYQDLSDSTHAKSLILKDRTGGGQFLAGSLSTQTAEELRTLEEKADPRLSLMIRFLDATSCRVSEMLGAEVGKARRGARITYLEIAGNNL